MPPSSLARSLLIRIGQGEAARITVQDLGTGKRTTFASWESFLRHVEGSEHAPVDEPEGGNGRRPGRGGG